MKSLRQNWINLILSTTAFVHVRKEKLKTEHLLRACVGVLVIILAEVWLMLISVPFQFLAGTQSFDKVRSTVVFGSHYRLRYYLSRSLAVFILFVFVVKMGVILYLYSSHSLKYVFEESSSGPIDTEFRLVNLAGSSLRLDFPVAYVDSVQKQGDQLMISGRAEPGNVVVVEIMDTNKSYQPLKLYSELVDGSGKFNILSDRGAFDLAAGDYVAKAFVYDEESGVKGTYGPDYPFSISDPLIEKFLLKFDKVLNIITLVFVSSSLLLILIST